MKSSQNNRPKKTRKNTASVLRPHGQSVAAQASLRAKKRNESQKYTASGRTKNVPVNTAVQKQNTQPQNTQTRPVRRARRRPLTPRERAVRYLKKKLAALPYLLPEGDTLARGFICAGLILFFALLQTTVFARFRPFGAIPDLMLPLVVALAMTEGEKWGAVCGLVAAFVIESLGATGVTLLPILYAAVGYFCPIVTRLHLTDSVPVRILYTAVTGVGRAIFTLIYLGFHAEPFRFFPLCGSVVIPEYAATFLLAILPHLAVHICLHPFHKSRAERTETL